MASTVLTNMDFNSSTWKDTLLGEFTDKLGLLSAGVMQEAPDNIISPMDKGYYVSLPKWNTISGDSVPITDGLSTTVNALTNEEDRGVWCEREKAWGADQIIKVVSGNDPMGEVARQVGQYLAVELHKQAVNVITGVFATELASTHSTGTDYTGAAIDTTGILAARQKLGDNQDELVRALLNSKVYSDALATGMITNQITNVANEMFRSGMIGNLLGMSPVMTDKFTATASVYPSYFAALGALVYKFRERTQSVQSNANITRISVGGLVADLEKWRVALTSGGQDVLILRYSALTHIPGVKYDDTGGSNPTNAVLATGTSWTKVASDDKLIKIVELKTL
jgi:hypothetical protein